MSAPHVAVIGNVNVDMVMGPQAPWPEPGTEVVLPEYELRPGGSAGNAALALQALGVPVMLLANAGDDVLGRWLKDSFGNAAHHWRPAARPTTVSVGITHPNGERTFFTNEGHLEALGPDDVLRHLPEDVADGSVALLCGAFLSPPLVAAFGEILDALRAANYRIALDTGWPPEGWTGAVRRHVIGWLGATDFLLLNEREALALAGTADLEKSVASIRPLMPERATLVVKRGGDGAAGWQRSETAAVPAPRIKVADSIGAGDVFNAGFLTAGMRGAALGEALRAGVEFASAVIATRPRRYRV
ncbi:MAG TPA: carbohydrate kinase family protein [Propylenella sp.]